MIQKEKMNDEKIGLKQAFGFGGETASIIFENAAIKTRVQEDLEKKDAYIWQDLRQLLRAHYCEPLLEEISNYVDGGSDKPFVADEMFSNQVLARHRIDIESISNTFKEFFLTSGQEKGKIEGGVRDQTMVVKRLAKRDATTAQILQELGDYSKITTQLRHLFTALNCESSLKKSDVFANGTDPTPTLFFICDARPQMHVVHVRRGERGWRIGAAGAYYGPDLNRWIWHRGCRVIMPQ